MRKILILTILIIFIIGCATLEEPLGQETPEPYDFDVPEEKVVTGTKVPIKMPIKEKTEDEVIPDPVNLSDSIGPEPALVLQHSGPVLKYAWFFHRLLLAAKKLQIPGRRYPGRPEYFAALADCVSLHISESLNRPDFHRRRKWFLNR